MTNTRREDSKIANKRGTTDCKLERGNTMDLSPEELRAISGGTRLCQIVFPDEEYKIIDYL